MIALPAEFGPSELEADFDAMDDDAISESRFKNQSALVSRDVLKSPIYMIGAGSIGSFTALTLAKMGFDDIYVQDMDTIEEHNIANQFYPEDSVGQHKIDALDRMVKDMSGVTIGVNDQRWDNTFPLGKETKAVIVAVDNMDLRKEIWDAYKYKVNHFIEARMGAEVAMVYTINTQDPNEFAYYETTLYPQSQALPDRCAAKSIIYTVLGCAAIIASTLKRALSYEKYPTEVVYDFVTHTQTRYKAEAKPQIVEANAPALSV
jgi:molybdopterin/thiamine biosynthesis adenylyltransferase